MQKPILLLAGLFSFYLGTAQKSPRNSESDRNPDLSIVSVAVAYPGPAKPPTVNTARGPVSGDPNSAAANPVTLCTVTINDALSDDDNVVVNVTLPMGVKVQQSPAGSTVSPGPDYHANFDGAIHIPVGSMRMGQTVSVQFTYSTPTVASIRNSVTASVTGSKPDANGSNNSRQATLQ